VHINLLLPSKIGKWSETNQLQLSHTALGKMMFSLLSKLVLIRLLNDVVAAPGWSPHGGHGNPYDFVQNVTLFDPPTDWTNRHTGYGRTVLLKSSCEKDDVLLATWAQSPPTAIPYWYIYESRDKGHSWHEKSKAYFHATSKGGRVSQPHLFELPKKVGKYPAGTVLLTGNAVPNNTANPRGSSTNIEVHASLDKGYDILVSAFGSLANRL
jgi:hypothetical protein